MSESIPHWCHIYTIYEAKQKTIAIGMRQGAIKVENVRLKMNYLTFHTSFRGI